MAHSILVVAESGSGKSTAIRDLNPEETFVINIANKPLPFKGWRTKYKTVDVQVVDGTPKYNIKSGNMVTGRTAGFIMKVLNDINLERPEIKNIVIDDFQYMSAFEYFDRANEKGYDKFTQIALNLAMVARKPQSMRDDLYVFFLTHSEESTDVNGNRRIKAKTVGKMIDNALTLEGLYSIVLFGKVVKLEDGTIKYVFETKNNGENTCKSPDGMFTEKYIENSLQIVKDAIVAYEND